MTVGDEEREAMFEFARRLADADFRKLLTDHGCCNTQDVVVALDGTSVADVLDRVFTRARPPAFVAVRRESASRGFVFMLIKAGVAPEGPSLGKVELLRIGDTISIGMLYDSATAARGVTFELGSHFRYNVQPVGSRLVEA